MTEVSVRLRDLKPEYHQLWQSCQIKSDQLEITKQIVAKIRANRVGVASAYASLCSFAETN